MTPIAQPAPDRAPAQLRSWWPALRNRLFGHDIFISYASADKAWAEAIEKLLKTGRYRVFRDHSGLNTGEHLDRLLAEVRRSTMLVVLVSENSMKSDWVHRELRAYLERPSSQWRIGPVFMSAQYPSELPDRFRVLGDFHGVALPIATGEPGAAADVKLRTEIVSGLRATRISTWRRLAFAAVCLAAAIFSLYFRGAIEQRRSATSREFAARAMEVRASNRAQALEFAVQALKSAPTPEARLAAALVFPQPLAAVQSEGSTVEDAAFLDGAERFITVGKDGSVSEWSSRDARRASAWKHRIELLAHATLSSGAKLLLTRGMLDRSPVQLWRTAGETLVANLAADSRQVSAVQFSAGGGEILTGGYDNAARLWSAKDGSLLAVMSGHAGPVWGIDIAANGELIATSSTDQTAKIWNRGGRLLQTLEGHRGSVGEVAFSPDGAKLVTSGLDGTARLWNTSSGALIAVLRGHEGNVFDAAFSPDGLRIVTTGSDGTVRLWSAADGRPLLTMAGHSRVVRKPVFSHDGSLILTSGADGTVRLWHAPTGRLLETLQCPGDKLPIARLSPDGRRALTSNGSNTTVWNTGAASVETVRFAGHHNTVWRAEPSPDGRRVVTASGDGSARIWDVRDGREIAKLDHKSSVMMALFSPDGGAVLTASDDATAGVWDARGGRRRFTLEGHAGFVQGAAFSPDGRWIATAGNDPIARLWDASSGKPIAALRGHSGSIGTPAFSPDGRRLVTPGSDKTARVWSIPDGVEWKRLEGHTGSVTRAVYSPDGQWIATASADGNTRLWRADTGQLTAVLDGRGFVRDAAFSPDSRLLATVGQAAMLWEIPSGRLAANFEGHRDFVRSVAFAPDGSQIVTASEDGVARVWRVPDGSLLAILDGHQGKVWHASFFPDGRTVVTASGDSTARVFRILTQADLIRLLK